VSKPKFSRNLVVGFNDRGHGHGDYGVVRSDGALIAKLNDLHFVESVRQPDVLPMIENACLFSAAPDLFEACLKALPTLSAAGDSEAVATIKAAIKKALPSNPSRKNR
jgi:hypothetical protein